MLSSLKKFFSSLYIKMLIPSVILFFITFFTDGTYKMLIDYNAASLLFMIFMNILPLYFCVYFFYHISTKMWISTLITGGLFGIFHTINCYKIIYRAEPFRISDILTVKEATNIIQNYTLEPQSEIIWMWILFLVLIVGIFFLERYGFFKPHDFDSKGKKVANYITRAFVSLCIMLCIYNLVYQNTVVMSNITTTKEYLDSVKKQKRTGFIAYVLSGKMINDFNVPEDYNPEEMKILVDEYEKKAEEVNSKLTKKNLTYPNIIAVMSESFFDPQIGESVEFYPGKNPLENYNRIKKSPYTRYGEILVPGIGGGTSDTEYEFLTGSNVSVLDTTMPPVFKTYLKEKTYSIVHHMKDLGYETHGIHPGHRWFYNRGEVYQWLGFDDFLSMESLPEDVDMINFYVTDDVSFGLIKESYDNYLMKDEKKGYFNFTVTIQNHGPYMDYETEREPVLKRECIEDEKLYNSINNYMIGLSDSDRMLKNLEEYINSVSEPTVVVFFGDHLPYFDEKREGLKLLGIDVEEELEDLARRHTTPYMIFGNKAFLTWQKVNRLSPLRGNGGRISASFLSGELFDYAHIEKPALNVFTDELKEKLQAMRHSAFYISDGNITKEVPEYAEEKLKEYQKLICYYNTEWAKENK